MYPKKVLIVSENLGFGGKESHVVAMCRELTKNGVTVVAMTTGGAFVPLLREMGVLHLEAPMYCMDKAEINEAAAAVNKVINIHKPDLVHSHLDTPQKWLYAMCRSNRMPLVTSVFQKSPKTLTKKEIRWMGKNVIAFNETIRKYLHEECEMQSSHIFMSVEGVDTELFSYKEDVQKEVRAELNVPHHSKIILSVARMEPGADMGVRRLLLEAPNIRRRFPNVYIFIAGTGSTFPELLTVVRELNEIGGETYIVLLGGRTDIHRLYMAADVCVASSRTALEAMSSSCIVVLAGSKGFLGILDTSTLEAALATNFSCEGHPYPSENGFIDAIVYTFMRDSMAQRALGEFGRNVILNNYPSHKMSLDTQRTYFMAMLGSPRARYDFILCGYYGYGSAGDSLLLETIVKNLRMRNPRAAICIINRDKNYDYAPLDVALVDRHSPSEIRSFIKRSRVLIFGGGNLLQDDTSLKSLLYYLRVFRLARRYELKTMLYGNGVGPLHHRLHRWLVQGALQKIDTITLRDRNSHKLVKSIVGNIRRVMLTADEMFSALKYPLNRPQGLPNGKYMAVSVCDLTKKDNRLWEKLAFVLDNLSRACGFSVVLVPLEGSLDMGVCRTVAEKMQAPTMILEGTTEEQVAAITNSALTIAMRPQAIIFATAAGVPCAQIGWDAQMRAISEETESELFFEANPFDQELFFDKVNEAMRMYAETQSKAKTMAGVLSGQAMENSTEAYRLLAKKIVINN